ncbi:hypothetical protein ACHAWF_011234 [Thalassiosira exigua]
MDRFIGDLRRYTHDLKGRQLAFGGISLSYAPRAQRDDDAVLRCDRYLLIHWKNFMKSLLSYDDERGSSDVMQHSRGEQWELSNIELTEAIINLLEPVLVNRESVRTLYLENNEFGNRGVALVCNIIESRACIESVSFHKNPIEDLGDMTRFCDAVGEHPSLKRLSLENVGLNGDEDKLKMILDASKNLDFLSLSGNGLRSRGTAQSIIHFLMSNSMKGIYLRDNEFGDESADLFVSLLRNNHRLRAMDISGNSFTQAGRRSINDALFGASSLNAAVESNHACAAYIDGPESHDRMGAINITGTSEGANLHRKIYSLLYATAERVNLFQLLHAIPLGLMPNLLAYLQDYCIEDIPRGMKKHAIESLRQYTFEDYEEIFSRQTTLTVMFEMMRSWTLLMHTKS